MIAVAEPSARSPRSPRSNGRSSARTIPRSPTWRTIRVEGIEARYLCAGSGQPVLLVASPLVLARTYLPVMRALAPRFTVVVVELPGAGGSDRLDQAWTFERYGEWTIELVRRMPLAAPILVGHSDAAPVVIEAARLAPAEVRAVALVGPCGACPARSTLRVVAARARDALGELGLTLRMAPHLVTNALRHRKTFLDHVRAAARVDVASAARELRVPTLLAWGDRDRTVPLACASRLGREIPDAKLVVGSGSHDWLVTAPDAFAAALRRFVEESVRRRGSLSLQP